MSRLLPTCQEEPFEGTELCRVCRRNDGPFRRCARQVTVSEPFRALLDRAAAIAVTDASVVILGESGAGKEVLARAIHANSTRAKGPFVAINVAALPSELLESELFGHKKGAFTGATSDKQGLFAAAEGGTLLLDEIGEMPLALQAKLLRALQDGEIRRVGDVAAFRVDVRILVATNQDLLELVEQRRFRQDLYYRLKVFALRVPALRERVDDILPLARQFLEQGGHASLKFTPAAEQALRTFSWPGNIRELLNAVRHGAILSGGRDVELEHLPEELAQRREGRAKAKAKLRTLAEVEREHMLAVLEACDGKTYEAARVLGISRSTLWRRLSEHQVSPSRKTRER